jgi:hypothetical protein
MKKEFLMKDISGRGYTRFLDEDEIRETFKDTSTIDDISIIDELLYLDLGDKFDLEAWCLHGEWSATILIRTK